jgi:hypothetical protein
MLLKTQLEHLRRTTPSHKSIEPIFNTSIHSSYASISPLYKYEQELLDYKNMNRMTGGAISRNEEANRAVREHQKQLLNNRLNFISQVQGRRIVQGYSKPREEENPLVFQQIKQLYLRLFEFLKNNNYQKDIITFPQKIETLLLNAGYYLSSSELDQINNYNATGLELTLSDLVQDVFDYKDRNIYDTVRSLLKRLTKIIKNLRNFVNNTVEERKKKLSYYKNNLENSLLDKAKVLEKQEKIEKEAAERLKYDDKFMSLLQRRQTDKEQKALEAEQKRREEFEEEQKRLHEEKLLKEYHDRQVTELTEMLKLHGKNNKSINNVIKELFKLYDDEYKQAFFRRKGKKETQQQFLQAQKDYYKKKRDEFLDDIRNVKGVGITADILSNKNVIRYKELLNDQQNLEDEINFNYGLDMTDFKTQDELLESAKKIIESTPVTTERLTAFDEQKRVGSVRRRLDFGRDETGATETKDAVEAEDVFPPLDIVEPEIMNITTDALLMGAIIDKSGVYNVVEFNGKKYKKTDLINLIENNTENKIEFLNIFKEFKNMRDIRTHDSDLTKLFNFAFARGLIK